MTPPFPKSWWVDPPNLLAGCYPGARDPGQARQKLQALLTAGIRVVLSLQDAGETSWDGQPFLPYEPLLAELARGGDLDVRCQRFPIEDWGVPHSGCMAEILDTIDAAIAADKPVYVHCWGGHGRTGTVVGCWLVRHGLTGPDALDRIRELRQHDAHLRVNEAPQTPDQRQLILDWRERDDISTRYRENTHD